VPGEGDASVVFTFAGRPVTASAGQSIGAALLAADVRMVRRTRVGGAPRGLFCGIGHCFDCLVSVDGGPPVRACLTPMADGSAVEPGRVPHERPAAR
jgi:predicted molibdopterin-dependent oxidoreductase YjgC